MSKLSIILIALAFVCFTAAYPQPVPISEVVDQLEDIQPAILLRPGIDGSSSESSESNESIQVRRPRSIHFADNLPMKDILGGIL